MVNYFFDTYAMVEILAQNPSYRRFHDFPFFTSILNKIEIYYWALTNHEQELAEHIIESFTPSMEITNDIIQEAMLFRKKYSKKNVSYADAVGYTLSRKHHLLFLTGDPAFEGMPGVEFVR